VGWCDLDRSCDGICTVVVPSPHDVRCYVLFGGSCGGGGGPEVGSPVVPVCNASVAIPLTDVRPRRTLFAGRVVARCRPPASGACPATTTTTLPPGVPDLTSDWIVSELDASDDCLVPPSFDFSTQHSLSLYQLGTALGTLGDAVNINTEGAVSPDGFTLDSGDCCATQNYDYAQRVSGTLPSPTGVAWLTEEWTFSRLGSPGGAPVCRRTAHAVMVRVPHPCTRDTDCLVPNPCSRCVAGNCVLAPVFRVRYRPASD